MTIQDADREELDLALEDLDLTLLLISGSEATAAPGLHAKAEQVQEGWHATFWIRDLALLSDEERELWFARGGRYAVLCSREDEDGAWSWEVGRRGDHAELLTPAGNPSGLFILEAFGCCSAEEDEA